MMKPLSLLFLSAAALVAKPVTLELAYKEGDNARYPQQIQTAFTKLLASDKALAGEFAKMQSPVPAGDRVGSAEEPKVVSIVVSEANHIDFQGDNQALEIRMTVALYYRFDVSMRRESSTDSGFFAVFAVTGSAEFHQPADGDSTLKKSGVSAEFQGFTRTLTAPDPGVDEALEPEK